MTSATVADASVDRATLRHDLGLSPEQLRELAYNKPAGDPGRVRAGLVLAYWLDHGDSVKAIATRHRLSETYVRQLMKEARAAVRDQAAQADDVRHLAIAAGRQVLTRGTQHRADGTPREVPRCGTATLTLQAGSPSHGQRGHVTQRPRGRVQAGTPQHASALVDLAPTLEADLKLTHKQVWALIYGKSRDDPERKRGIRVLVHWKKRRGYSAQTLAQMFYLSAPTVKKLFDQAGEEPPRSSGKRRTQHAA